jgi:F-type H+-transporting ATPase subunit gamma
MVQIREIKKRMVAVGTIQRITKTMQMIATAKFTAAVQRTKATQPYTKKIRELVAAVCSDPAEVNHPLAGGDHREVGRDLVLVISSDRGLCGAYNSHVLRMARNLIRAEKDEGKSVQLEISGRKAGAFFKFEGIEVSEQHDVGDKPDFEVVSAIADRFMDEYIAGEFDAVYVVYMRFQSSSRQVPEVMQLLPLQPPSDEDEDSEEGTASVSYEFSPDEEQLLNDLLPRAIRTALFQAYNDSVVSEQIMRMIAMKAATDNASELGRTLKRDFNRARQAKITTELTEIISGAAALE